jgi:hypothetical protein
MLVFVLTSSEHRSRPFALGLGGIVRQQEFEVAGEEPVIRGGVGGPELSPFLPNVVTKVVPNSNSPGIIQGVQDVILIHPHRPPHVASHIARVI